MQKSKDCQLVFVCHGKDCLKKGAKDLRKEIKHQIKKNKIKNLQVVKCKCLDRCKMAPSVVYGQQWFGRVKAKDIEQILNS